MTTKQIDEIVRLYVDEGLSTEKVALRIGVAKSTVGVVLQRRGVPMRAKTRGVGIDPKQDYSYVPGAEGCACTRCQKARRLGIGVS